jgi:shikimate kinase
LERLYAVQVISSRNAAHRRKAVVLVGFMGAGKTSVGQALAQRLGWRFVDLDHQIEARERRSIAEIFRDSGEQAFRQAETAALQSLLKALGDGDPTVVALGGGAFAQPANVALLQSALVPTIFLDATADELWERCCAQGLDRPLLRDDAEFARLYEERRPHYLKAGVRLQTSGKPTGQVVREIESLIGEQQL